MLSRRVLREAAKGVTRACGARNIHFYNKIAVQRASVVSNSRFHALEVGRQTKQSCVEQIRHYAAARLLEEPAKEVSYEQVLDIVKHPDPETLLVDARERDEYAAGHIPGAVNIPYRSSPGALGLDPAEFQDTFGFEKPGIDKKLVFYCQGGVRSTGAEQLASTYGYQKRENYKGSYEDWLAHNGATTKPAPQENVETAKHT